MIKLFDLVNGNVIPTEHCYILDSLKNIMTEYPDNYLKAYAFIFYMSCPNPELNPFFEMHEDDKEEIILQQLNESFSTEEDAIYKAIQFCKKLYETPTYRAYMGVKSMIDRLAKYMEETNITHGRDGNITALVNTVAKFDQIRVSFKGVYQDLKEEQNSSVRGKKKLAYDQM